jgi:DNA-binding MarR family transcriptional regulator
LMDQPTKSTDVEETRIVLGLLEYVERGGEQSQRRLASELGVALGLVNAYIKRCVRKGLVKVRHAPARRYAYYLTPRGFAEKSRLTVEYMSYSLSLFRRAKTDCTAAFAAARERGYTRMALLGLSDLAEIATICALDSGMTIVAVIEPNASAKRFAGAPVAANLDEVAEPVDAVLVTDMRTAGDTAAAAIARCGPERVFMPALLGGLPNLHRGAA